MKCLILDPGHSTGYCILDLILPDKKCVILEYGFYDVDKSSEYSGDWCIDLQKWVKNKIKTAQIETVAREDYFFSNRFATGGSVNVAYRTAIDIQVRKLNLTYTVINPSLWKKYICGRIKPIKEQIDKYGKDLAKKCMVQESLWVNYKLRFPNFAVSQKNGRTIKFRYDTVDAVAIGIYFSKEKFGCEVVENKMAVPEDFDWKAEKTEKKGFSYKDFQNLKKCEYNYKNGKKCEKMTYSDKCSLHIKYENINKK